MKKSVVSVFLTFTFLTTLVSGCVSNSNPTPVGEAKDVGDGMSLTILSMIRPANSTINEPLQPDSEYVMVNLRIHCDLSTNKTCNFGLGDLLFADQNGDLSESEVVVPYTFDALELITEIPGGSTIEGAVVFLISKDEKPAKLVYQILYGSPSFFAIP